MPESYIQLPQDGTGKKTRTHSTLIGGQEVHQQVVKVANQGDNVINPSTEETLQSVLSKLNDVLTQLQQTLSVTPSFSDSSNVDKKALVDSDRHLQVDVVEVLEILLKTLLNSPLVRVSIDNVGRLRTLVESAPTTAVSQSGVWMFPSYSAGSMVFQLANIEYNECQRSKFTFT